VTSRFVRVLLVVLAVMATAGLAYRGVQDELETTRQNGRTREVERAADQALTFAADLRAALFAYVAAGQEHDYWTTRSGALVEGLRASIGELSAAAPAADAGLDPGVQEIMRKLVTAEGRARRYVRDDQPRLAADILFTDARDLLDSLRSHVTAIRDSAGAGRRARDVLLRRQQALLAGGALLVWIIVASVLAPLPVDARRAAPGPPAGTPAPVNVDRPKPGLRPAPSLAQRASGRALASPPSVAVPHNLKVAAEVCTELAQVSDGQQIAVLLQRAAQALNASGLVVWIADPSALYPVAACGYDARLLARIRSIPRDGANLTADALRGGLRKAAAEGGAPPAFAVPLLGPGGPVGVLSGEVRDVLEVPEATAAIAAIVAAQLATLVASLPSSDTNTRAQQAQPANV
jgi:hypothetical protein